MRMDISFSLYHFDERFKRLISPRRHKILFSGRFALIVIVPLLFVFTRLRECLANHFFHSHARRRITLWSAGRRPEIGTLRVLPQRELDARKRALERQGV